MSGYLIGKTNDAELTLQTSGEILLQTEKAQIADLGADEVTNGNFEGSFSSGLASNWNKIGDDNTFSEETTIVHGGGKSQKVVYGGSETNAGIEQTSVSVPGKLYKVIALVRSCNSRTFHLELGYAGISVTVTADTWTKIGGSIVADGTSLKVYAVTEGSGDFYFDDVSVREITGGDISASGRSLIAEVKSAVEGVPMRDVDIAIAYSGGSTSDLPSTVTITDNSSAGDVISGTGTYTYDGQDRPTQFQYVFTDTALGTVTETYTYTVDNITAITRTIS